MFDISTIENNLGSKIMLIQIDVDKLKSHISL